MAWCDVGAQMEALYFAPTGASPDEAVGNLPDLPLPVSYPQYNSLALLPLKSPNYATQVSFCACLLVCVNLQHLPILPIFSRRVFR